MKINKKDKRKCSKGALIAVSALAAFLSGKQLIAQEVQNPESDKGPKVNITLDYSTGIQEEGGATGENYYSFYDRDQGALYTNLPEITSAQKTQVEEGFTDVQNREVNSYSEFVDSSENFSENQDFIFLATTSNALNEGSYDYSLPHHKVFPQDTFFEQFQNYLATGEYSPLGVCRHIASHIEQLSNDIGLRANAVTGRFFGGTGHVYVIVKREDGTGIIDGGNIILSDTKNIEKMLEIYQLQKDSTTFQHLFFEDSILVYRLVTKDGKNFLKFIEMDESLKPLKDSLTGKQGFNRGVYAIFSKDGFSLENMLSLDIAKDDYSLAGKLNAFGFFGKIGQIRGNSYSPTEEMNLAQFGFEGKVSLWDILQFSLSASKIYGEIVQKERTDLPEGSSLEFLANTLWEKGFNVAFRMAGEYYFTETSTLFNKTSLELGTSCKIPLEKISITPYVAVQESMLPLDLGTSFFSFGLSEVNAGINLNIPFTSNSGISINPHYAYKPCEHEVGANVELETKNIGADAGIYVTKSIQDFNPDKLGMDIGVSASFDNFEMRFGYKNEMKDYDGEISNNSSISLTGKLKF